MEKNHFLSVAGLVTNEDNNILLIKSPFRGWEYPGGMVEAGETLQEALKREIFEESGVIVEINGFIGICKNIKKDIVNVDFYCRYISGELTTSSESLAVQWFSKEEAVRIVQDDLTKKRLKNMLSSQNTVKCFSVEKDPFKIIEDCSYKVGL